MTKMPTCVGWNWQNVFIIRQDEKQLKVPSGLMKEDMKSVSYAGGKGYASSTPHPINGLDHKSLFLSLLLGCAVIVALCLAAVSFYHVIELKAELALLTSKLNCRVQTRTSFPLSLRSQEKSKEVRPFIPYLKMSEGASNQVSYEIFWK